MNQLRISGHQFKLVLAKPHSALSHENVGRFDSSKNEITLDSTQSPAHLRTTLLHELIHAADRFHGKNDITEEQVLAIEHGLWAIFSDNPGLADVIFKGKKL